MRSTFFRNFIFIGSLGIALGAIGAYAVMNTGTQVYHHKTAHEACPQGAIDGEQTRVEGGTDGDVDVYHFYTCIDGTEVNANG